MLMAEYATSIEIEASPEEVFECLVTPDGMTAWMGQRADLDPCPGGAFDVDIAGSLIRGRYLEVDRPRRVVVSWGVADSAEFPPGASRVSFTLTPTAHGTRHTAHESTYSTAGYPTSWSPDTPRAGPTSCRASSSSPREVLPATTAGRPRRETSNDRCEQASRIPNVQRDGPKAETVPQRILPRYTTARVLHVPPRGSSANGNEGC